MALEPDNDQGETGFAQRLHYQQSIDSEFKWRILGQTRKTQDPDTDFDFVQAELLWQLDDTDNYLSGVRFDIRIRDCSAQLFQDTFLKELCSYSTGDRAPLAAEESFNNSVIPTRSYITHTGSHAIIGKQFTIMLTGIL